MNEDQIRHALSLNNTAHVSEATRIPPHTLQHIIDGKHIPSPDEIDALAGWFSGEYSLSGTDFNWKRKRKQEEPVGTLPLAGETVYDAEVKYELFAPPPNLQAGPRPTGTGALEDGDGHRAEGEDMRIVKSEPIPSGMARSTRDGPPPVVAYHRLPQGASSPVMPPPVLTGGAGELFAGPALDEARAQLDAGRDLLFGGV